MAKTVMGAYSASDMIDHLKQQGHAPPGQQPAAPAYRPHSPSAPPPVAHQPPAAQPYQPPAQPYQSPAAPYQQATIAAAPSPHAPAPLAPASNPSAKTVFAGPPNAAPSGPTPAGAFGAGGGMAPPAGAFGGAGPVSHPVGTSPSHASSVPLAAPPPPATPMPMPSAAPPYLASQTAARAGRPVEPWKDTLRTMMFVWGAALLVVFVTPLSVSPLRFQWDLIANADGVGKLPPLIIAAVGLLSVVLAAIPMSPAPRGILATLLGLAGTLVPMFLAGMPPWQSLVPVAGLVILIPALFVRNEYRDAMLPRVLVTVGVVATLVPLLIPQHGSLPLVELFKAAIDAPGSAKLLIILLLAQIALVVLALLAWLPAPSSGGGKLFAWLLILSPVAIYLAFLIVTGMIGFIPDSPALADIWVAGSASTLGAGKEGAEAAIPTGFGLGVAYAALIGYGLATVIGKNLE